MKNKKVRLLNKNYIYITLGILFILLVWHILSVTINQEVMIPKVSSTFRYLLDMFTRLHTYKVLGLTLIRLLIAISASFIISLILSLVSIWVYNFSNFIKPLITLLRTIPIVAIIIILLVFVGNKNASIYITSLVIIPIMYETLLNGMQMIDKKVLDEIKMISNTNVLILKDIYIPTVKPYAIVALIQSIGLGFKALVMSEFITSPKYSIGKEMNNLKNYLEMEGIFAWTIVLLILVFIFEVSLKNIKAKVIEN